MKKKMFWLSGLMTTAAASIAAYFGYSLSNKIMYIEKKDDDFIYDRELKARRFDENWYNNCRKQELTIDSPNGYPIKGVFLQPHDTKNTVIICHGVTENKINSIKYARMFVRLGFNAFVYDHRRHGESGGKTTSYGYYEKFDLEAVVKTVRSIIGDDAILGIHGESMGAATTLLYAGSLSDQADFYVSDCAFSDFEKLLYRIMITTTKFRTQIPVHLVNFFLKFRDGYIMRNIKPIDVVENIKKPVLFIHSKPDDFIPCEMTEEMYERKQGPKAIKLFDIGAHAKSFNENPQEYEEVVRKFIDEFVDIKKGSLA